MRIHAYLGLRTMFRWLTGRSRLARIRYAAHLFVDYELPRVSPQVLARATAQAVAVAAEWAQGDGPLGGSESFGILTSVSPVGLLDAVRLHRLLEATRARLHSSRSYARSALLKRLGQEQAEIFEQITESTEIGMGLLVLRAASRFDTKCRARAETVAGMLRDANTPENIAASVDYIRRCNETEPALSPAPLGPEELAQAIREFVATYAEPVLTDA